MSLFEDTGVFGLTHGCPDHGEDAMSECSMCGMEFCRMCYASSVCEDCFQQQQLDEDEDDSPDFEDVKNLDALLGEDKEVEKILQESESEFPPDLFDED
ncbi:MAG: hypothetical protein AAF492_09840 [Verrucomicrobiota bacterium]